MGDKKKNSLHLLIKLALLKGAGGGCNLSRTLLDPEIYPITLTGGTRLTPVKGHNFKGRRIQSITTKKRFF